MKNTTFADPQEKFNVWVSYLNLEANFGNKVEEVAESGRRPSAAAS